MSEIEEKYGEGTVKFEKPAPDKTVEQEMYGALKNANSILNMVINATATGHNRNLLADANIYLLSAIQKYESLNSK